MGSYSSVEYRLVHQDDSESEGEQLTPLRRNVIYDKMNLSVHNRPLLLASYLIVSLIGVTLVITTIVWAAVFKGGVSFTRTELGISFNWHPILMTISLIFLYGNGALIYRVIPPRSDSHNLARNKENQLAPKPNMYTLHSWVGILAATLFGCQWMLGFLAFLFPKFSADLRALVLPIHQYLGSAILVLAAAAALLGHLEKAIWSNKQYNEYNPEAIIVNITGILIVLFVMGVTFILSKFSTEQPNKER